LGGEEGTDDTQETEEADVEGVVAADVSWCERGDERGVTGREIRRGER